MCGLFAIIDRKGRTALDHPADFFDVFANWEDLLATYASRPGHPLGDLAALINKFELG